MSAVFFFSSRRRHTILTCDWSSDVCSSDLPARSQIQALLPSCRKKKRSGLPRAPYRRSEERRVGKEGRSRGATAHLKKKKKKRFLEGGYEEAGGGSAHGGYVEENQAHVWSC